MRNLNTNAKFDLRKMPTEYLCRLAQSAISPKHVADIQNLLRERRLQAQRDLDSIHAAEQRMTQNLREYRKFRLRKESRDETV